MPHSEDQRTYGGAGGVATASASRPPAGSSLSQSTSSASNIPPSSSSTSTSTAPPLTMETTLAAYSNDPMVALEAVLQERNSLSAQNAQLWKLIEKQRALYNAANRELEKLKLAANIPGSNALNSNITGGRANGSIDGSSGSSSGRRPERPERAEERKGKMSRTNSEEHNRTLSPARSIELLGTSPFSSAPKLNGTTYTETTTISTPTGNTPQKPVRGDSLPTPAPAPIPAAPLNVQKKSSLPTSTPSTSTSTSSATPVPAVPTLSVPTIVSTPNLSTQPPVVTNNALSPSIGGTGDLLPPRNRREARESRITLPDEAARYIAAMNDSPMGSPGMGEFGASSNTSNTSTGNGSLDADVTLKGKGESLLQDDDSSEEEGTPGASPIEAEVSYPPVVEPTPRERERKQPPPPINAPSHQMKSHHGRGVNGTNRGASIDSNDMATPMANQSYSVQQSSSGSHPNAPTREVPLPPNQPITYPGHSSSSSSRPQLHTQSSSGSQTRPSLQETQRPSFSVQSTTTTVTSDYPYQIGEGLAYRDVGFYDTGSGAPSGLPQAPTGYPQPQQGGQRVHGHSHSHSTPQLSASDLGHLKLKISGSQIRSNERGKDVLSFLINVQTPRSSSSHGPDEWKIEKMYSDVLTLDGKVRSALGRSQGKKLPVLPDAKLFRDNAPAKVDQRRAFLEQYLQALLHAPLKDMSDLCHFFSTDLSRGDRAPVTSQGYKEGYLTKRGKSFGGWKTRYFVLQNSVLEYFENRGGTHLGSININGAQIGRQQKQASPDDDNAYRHAFLIIEQPRKGAAPARHVLCAASDAERDDWVDVLVRSVAPSNFPSSGSSTVGYPYEETYPPSDSTLNPSRPSTSSSIPSDQGPPGNSPVDRVGGPAYSDAQVAQRMIERNAYTNQASGSPGNVSLSSSLPSNLDNNSSLPYNQTRSNSSLGHYGDPKDPRAAPQSAERSNPNQMHEQAVPRKDRAGRTSYHPSLGLNKNNPADRGDDSSAGESTTAGSVLGAGAKKISGPLNAQPIPPGGKFGNKDGLGPESSPVGERDRKAKSGRFWPTFGKGAGNAGSGSERAHPSSNSSPASGYPHNNHGIPGRAVFGVPLEQALGIAQIANLPAIVFRCIEYLESKKAAEEEGIYRLSGSSAVIKALKDRFNHEGDVNLLKHDEFWDPHAIAGLLKQFLRDLPTSILTRELQQRFLSVVDLMDLNERVHELAHLVSQLPVSNYCLLRAMTAHLILIVQNSNTNKMTMRNVGIVFSPTLGIPAGILSLMLGEFDRVFNVDGGGDSSDAASSNDHDSYIAPQSERTPQKAVSPDPSTRRPSIQQTYGINKRNSMLYNNTATDRMLGIAGRKLDPTEDSSEGEEVTMPEESDFDSDHEESSSRQATSEQTGSGSPPSPTPQISVSYPVTDTDPTAASTAQGHMHGAKAVAATRGLQISVGKKMNRASGLPASPRPVRYPGSPGGGSSGNI